MDGVLCDFWTAAEKITQRPLETYSVSELWSIVKQFPGFWFELEQLPNADQLWHFIESKNGQILSALPYSDPHAKPGKLAWLDQNLQFTDSARIHLTRSRNEKQQFATNNGKPNILIDDYHKNINEWTEAGGFWDIAQKRY